MIASSSTTSIRDMVPLRGQYGKFNDHFRAPLPVNVQGAFQLVLHQVPDQLEPQAAGLGNIKLRRDSCTIVPDRDADPAVLPGCRDPDGAVCTPLEGMLVGIGE